MRSNSILYTLSLLAFLCTSALFGQQNSPTRIGFSLESNFSSLDYDGLTPSITLGNDCHEFQLGTRLNFNKMIGQEAKNPQRFVLDIGYRMVFFDRIKWLPIHGTFKTEYGLNTVSNKWAYEAPNEDDTEALDLGSSNFNASSEIKTHSIKFHLGLGTEISLGHNFYFKTDAALGIGGQTIKREYKNADTGNHVLHTMMLFGDRHLGWIVSAGFGYRIGSGKRW